MARENNAGADLERDEMYADLMSGGDSASPVYRVTKEEAPVTINTLMPEYRYRFEGRTSQSGDSFIAELRKFLEVNDYLIEGDRMDRSYADGFQKAVAVAALFMDSLELQQEQSNA